METKKMLIPLIVISILTLVIIGGCKKENPSDNSHENHDNAAMSGQSDTTAQAKEIYTCSMHPDYISDKPGTCPECGMNLIKKEVEQPVAQAEQKMCPVMTDMKINPAIFTEYQGKKVYFCCGDCKTKFEAEPEKYIANLPQFKN